MASNLSAPNVVVVPLAMVDEDDALLLDRSSVDANAAATVLTRVWNGSVMMPVGVAAAKTQSYDGLDSDTDDDPDEGIVVADLAHL